MPPCMPAGQSPHECMEHVRMATHGRMVQRGAAAGHILHPGVRALQGCGDVGVYANFNISHNFVNKLSIEW